MLSSVLLLIGVWCAGVWCGISIEKRYINKKCKAILNNEEIRNAK